MKISYKILSCIICLMVINACTAKHHRGAFMADKLLAKHSEMNIAVLPFESLTGNSYAGEIISDIFAAELYEEKLFMMKEESFTENMLASMKWSASRMGETTYATKVAKKLGADAVLYGAVHEYGYKVSLHEEPAVGISARLVSKDGRVLWSSSDAMQGGSVLRDSLSLTSQNLVNKMVKRLKRSILKSK